MRAGAEQFRNADQDFAVSVAAAERVLGKWGKAAADGQLFRIYNDVAHMYKRFKHYEPESVYNWIRLTESDLETYAGRMASMLQAAVDETAMNQICRQLNEAGFMIRSIEKKYFTSTPKPAAWILIADKPAV
jgi:hypothetical protein